MPTTYTSLLGLALPATGELTGTWGTTVNDSVTQLIEDAIAATATASVTSGDWTLTTTGSGASNQARCAVLIPTGSPGVSRNVIAPSKSKAYIVINQSNAAVVFKGSATTGVTLVAGEKTIVAWDGSDFVKVTVAINGDNPFTGANTFYNSTGQTFGTATSTQDGLILAGRAGGSSSYRVTLSPGTLTASRSVTFPDAAGAVLITSAAQTVTNKRIDPRVSSAATDTTLTPDISAYDQYCFTALASGLTINAPTGTPVDGDKLIFRFLDNGTPRALTWNATYTDIGAVKPTTTAANKTTYIGCIYNAANTRWDVVAVTTQA